MPLIRSLTVFDSSSGAGITVWMTDTSLERELET